jgi:hypothetical protein
MKNHNEHTCFDYRDELYLGSWFGHDVYLYRSPVHKVALLATLGNEPGDYATWVGDASWFEPKATIYYRSEDKSVPICEHLMTTSLGKAFLMGFASYCNRE